ncbi:MAG: nitrogenase component 1 [Coriobacteriales bacterium]|nr:nitrogenase component 1 [Coriobacteriales bacterium]
MTNIVARDTCAREARSFSAGELAQRGIDNLPDELVSAKHLIYSSPATLAFNSPGAEGFGVKRAGLAIPGSVMLIVAPGCCGRNTSLVSELPAYQGRFFYLTMDETDIVTGRHLRKIPQAVEEVVDCLPTPPSLVMICITCVDALLGTDMERVCRRAEERVSMPVRPCYMYALTREGRRPPMVHVRQSLYSLLEPRKKRPTSVNLLGFFAPLVDDCELYDYLAAVGVKSVREISRCADYDEFQHMAEANFNLVLHPEARLAAQDLQERLSIPSIELTRLYSLDRIRKQYQALGQVLGTAFDDAAHYDAAAAAVDAFAKRFGRVRFSVGECLNGDPFELALSLVRYGFEVAEVFGTLSGENFVFLRRLAELSPETRVYSNMEPTMLYYDAAGCPVDVALGKDAGWYHQEVPCLPWNSDVQPFGYAGVRRLFEALAAALEEVRS